MADNPKIQRRWLQFRLRTLLLVTAVLCVPLAWLAWKIDQKRHERAVIAELKRLGGYVYFDWDENHPYWQRPEPSGPLWLRKLFGDNFCSHVTEVHLFPHIETWRRKHGEPLPLLLPKMYTFGPSIDDDGLASVGMLSSLLDLDLDSTDIGDAGVTHLRRLTSLRILDLSETNITDQGLATVATLTGLEELHLDWTNIGDSGLANLSTLTKLRWLFLQHTNLTNAGLVHLRSLPNLHALHLQQTSLTDGGLENLKKLDGLTYLGVENTQISHEGMVELRKALPNCKIEDP